MTLKKLDELGLGIVKNSKYLKSDRRRRYEEDIDEVPSLQFFAGASEKLSIPKESLPEVGFCGRSNVGKSRLLNALFGTVIGGSIVRFADRPGVTKQLNFFELGKQIHLVDMPGYGFAYAKEEVLKEWKDVIEGYLKDRKSLKLIYLLVDSRHGFKDTDREFMELLKRLDIKFQVVMTKCDLVELQENYKTAMDIIIPVSSSKLNGIPTLRKKLLHQMGYKFAKNKREEKRAQIEKESKAKKQITKDSKDRNQIENRNKDKIEISKVNKKEANKDKKEKYNSKLSIDLLKNNIYDV
ncbi:P-loop containing nucleoside triphosphate hydrolase protein [Neoconidiobolus thromboides FSU 785]|nr:P-loop containing nucleoside triphosphate hydrolase protein [Neoconidiobolus thromboides FSU 785]